MMKWFKWTKEEFKQLLHEAYRLKQANDGIRVSVLFMEAQKALPADRQRVKISGTLQARLSKMFVKFAESSPTPPQPKPVEAPMESATPEVQVVVVEKPVRIEPDYGKIPTVVLARELLSRLALLEQIEQKFDALTDILKARAQVEAQYRPNLDVRRAITPVVEDKGIRVAIAGPLDSQFAELEARAAQLPRKVELRFIRKESHALNIPTSCDYAILTRHTNHSHGDAAEQQLGSDRVFYVDGGLTSIVQKLYDLCSRQ